MDDRRTPVTHWKKLGLVFRPDPARPWMRTHAQNPFTMPRGADLSRIYFSSRDDRGHSHVGWADLDTSAEPRIVDVAEEPILSPGPLGYFDDHGTLSSAGVEHNGTTYLYYIGWNPGKREPLFYASIGLALSTDGGTTFERYSPAPIIARDRHDPWMASACCVLLDGGVFRMWYISGLGWSELPDGTLQSFYHLKYAESRDGIEWKRDGRVAIELRGDETNIARPTILKEDGLYKMWYPVNSGASGYRMGYAESTDGYVWNRKDELSGIAPSADGFDSKAVTYPWVFRTGTGTYMIYNGNAFGREGIGLAVRS